MEAILEGKQRCLPGRRRKGEESGWNNANLRVRIREFETPNPKLETFPPCPFSSREYYHIFAYEEKLTVRFSVEVVEWSKIIFLKPKNTRQKIGVSYMKTLNKGSGP